MSRKPKYKNMTIIDAMGAFRKGIELLHISYGEKKRVKIENNQILTFSEKSQSWESGNYLELNKLYMKSKDDHEIGNSNIPPRPIEKKDKPKKFVSYDEGGTDLSVVVVGEHYAGTTTINAEFRGEDASKLIEYMKELSKPKNVLKCSHCNGKGYKLGKDAPDGVNVELIGYTDDTKFPCERCKDGEQIKDLTPEQAKEWLDRGEVLEPNKDSMWIIKKIRGVSRYISRHSGSINLEWYGNLPDTYNLIKHKREKVKLTAKEVRQKFCKYKTVLCNDIMWMLGEEGLYYFSGSTWVLSNASGPTFNINNCYDEKENFTMPVSK